MPASLVDSLAEVLTVTERLVDGVTDQQWTVPTPCTQWDVRALVNHLVGGNRLFTGILTGQTTLQDASGRPGDDHLGDTPVAAYREAADALVAAFARPGVLEEMVTVPFGTVPGRVALHLRITEVLVHGWDLARATDQPVDFPDEVVEQELVFTRGALPTVPPTRSPFAPARPVAADAPLIEQLAACLGRDVTRPLAAGEA